MNLRSIALAVLALGLASATQAQSKGTQDQQVKQQRAAAAQTQGQAPDRIAQLSKELQLSDDQTTRLRAADERRRASMTELRSGSGDLDRTQQGERSNAIMLAFEEEVKSIMTADQYTKYKELGKPRAIQAKSADTKPVAPPAAE